MMGANLVVSEDGRVFMTHDRQFPFVLNWAEYDGDTNTLSLISQDGLSISFGMAIPKVMRPALMKTNRIHTILIQREDIMDFYVIPMTSKSMKKI